MSQPKSAADEVHLIEIKCLRAFPVRVGPSRFC